MAVLIPLVSKLTNRLSNLRNQIPFLLYLCCSLCGFLKINSFLVTAHICNHRAPQQNEVVHGIIINAGNEHFLKKRSANQQLRIFVSYDISIDKLGKQQQDLIKNDLLLNAVEYWQGALQTRQTTVGAIRLLRQCSSDRVRYADNDSYPYCVDGCVNVTKCGESALPEEHLEACRVAPPNEGLKIDGKPGAGVADADYILYVSAYETSRCFIGSTVAYAAYCQLERTFDRPVAGYINLCPKDVSIKAHDLSQMHSTIKHEILHALGFSFGLYAFYRDSNGNPLTTRLPSTGRPPYDSSRGVYQWSERVVKTFVRSEWKVRTGYVSKTVRMLVTPAVVREVREHFACPTLEGAELEDQGVEGTSITHWEKRVFENEVMTGTYTQNNVISRITLALMEDTGWYDVDYEKAETLKWGKGLGCDFVQKSCLDWMESRTKRSLSIHPFCNHVKRDKLITECTDDGQAMAVCNLVQYPQNLSIKYQHFNSIPNVTDKEVSRYAGSVALADYCPYIQEFTWKRGNTSVRGSQCRLEHNNADSNINYLLEKYGATSRCFKHDQRWILKYCTGVNDVDHWGSGCYQYSCSTEYGLKILVGDNEYSCQEDEQVLQVQVRTQDWLHLGTIVCPPCAELCSIDVCSSIAQAPPKNMSIISVRRHVELIPPCNSASISWLSINSYLFSSILALRMCVAMITTCHSLHLLCDNGFS